MSGRTGIEWARGTALAAARALVQGLRKPRETGPQVPPAEPSAFRSLDERRDT